MFHLNQIHMSKIVNEITEIANEIIASKWRFAPEEAFRLAVKIQYNRILADAFMLDRDSPSALEAIAMELGASGDGSSIKDAIYSLGKEV